MESKAVARHDVEADAWHYHDPRVHRANIHRLTRFEDAYLARDVGVITPVAQARRHHRPRSYRERPGTVQDHVDFLQCRVHLRPLIEGEHAIFEPVLARRIIYRRLAPPRTYHPHTTINHLTAQ